MDLANQTVRVARSWLNVAFVLHGQTKDLGCDCAGLILGVARELQEHCNIRVKYPTWHMSEYSLDYHPPITTLLPTYLLPTQCLHPKPGLIALLHNRNEHYHLGIVGNYPLHPSACTLIHACSQRGKVIEHRFTAQMQSQLIGLYSFWCISEGDKTL